MSCLNFSQISLLHWNLSFDLIEIENFEFLINQKFLIYTGVKKINQILNEKVKIWDSLKLFKM